MPILHISPDSSALVHVAAAAVLYLHIGSGCLGLVSGSAALLLRKGSRLHKLAGNVFVVSMMIMAAIGASVAPFLPVPERASVLAGVCTFYLVFAAWATVRRKPGTAGLFDIGVLCASGSIAVAATILIWMAMHSPHGKLDGQPAGAFYIFFLIGIFATIGDLRLVLRGGIAGAQRIARHLWRMCVALFIAAGSLFLGQQQVFPASMRKSPVFFIPELVIVALLFFWLYRVRFSAAYKQQRAANLR
jgi:hypothetical protein